MRVCATAVQGVVCDCDGTLLDTAGVWVALQDEMARCAGAVLTADDRSFLAKATMIEAGGFFHDRFGLGRSAREVALHAERLAGQLYARLARPRPGVAAFLEYLARRGVRVAVASSSPRSVLRCGLERTGLMGCVDAVVSTDDVGVSKQSPAVFDLARSRISTALDATWVFEDSLYALACAGEAGYHTVAVWDSDEAGPFDDLARLADLAVRDWRLIDPARFVAGGYASR